MKDSIISRKNFLTYTGIGVGAVAVATLAGCAPEETPAATSASPSADPSATTPDVPSFELIRKMQDRGYAIVGFTDSPPSTMIRDGVPTGYNVEITMALLAKYGITKAESFQSDFAGMVPGLQSSQFDICVAGLLVTEERCEVMAYGPATNVLVYSFGVPVGNPRNLSAVADLLGTDGIVACEAATTQERIIREILPENQILTVSGRQDGVDAVRIGRADAYIAPDTNLKQVIESGGDPLDITGPLTDMPLIGACLTLRQEDQDFADQLKMDFAELQASGEYARILASFDGPEPSRIELPGVRLDC